MFRLLAKLPRKRKQRLRGLYERLRLRWVATFRSYGPEELLACFRALGLRDGDTVMLHAGFSAANGFSGNSRAVVDTLLSAIGSDGNLVMVSLPYRDSSLAFLQRVDCFDVRKTPSRMGLMSEFLRRRPGVLRSLHPTHPMLAYGPKADWLVEGHEHCPHGCGPGSPFDKALALGAKVLFFDAPFKSLTFFHWLEHHVMDAVGLPLYHPEPFDVPVIDAQGRKGSVTAYVFSEEIIDRRRFPILENQLRKEGLVRGRRLGNTVVQVADLQAIVQCVDQMTERGQFFYDMS